MTIWLVMLLGGALTYAMRLSFICIAGRVRFPEVVLQALKYVPPAVLAAIIMPGLFMPSGRLDISLDNHYLLAGVVAAVAGWFTRNTLVTLLAGVVALVVLQLVR